MKSVLVLFAEGSEELEAVTIVNILRRADVSVVFSGLQDGILYGSRGIGLVPDSPLDTLLDSNFDMVVLPGGQPGTRNLMADARVTRLLRRMAQQQKVVAAICAAPSVLAASGLLDGKNATSFPGALDSFPKVRQLGQAVVVDDKIITSRGPGTAIDFALTLVEQLVGKDKRKAVEDALQR